MTMATGSRTQATDLIRALLADGILTAQDLAPFAPQGQDPYDPEYVRQQMESWFKLLGIEAIIGRKFTLGKCTFTREELEQADANNEIVLVAPQGVSAAQLAKLFHIESWVFEDNLVSDTTEPEDLWFKTPKTMTPGYLNQSAKHVRRVFEDEHKLGMSLERYLIFIARMRHLTGETPDFRYWIWLMRGRYDRSGMLIAGIDPNGKFSVHGWMPNFQASFLGARYVEIPDRI